MAYRCQCNQESIEHIRNLCAKKAQIEVLRKGKSLYLCLDCELKSDKRVRWL